MNKNKILSGGGKNLTGGGKWGWRGREVGEGSGVKGRGKWGLGTPPCPPPPESHVQNKPLFGPLAVRVHTGCSAFPFYTLTKPLIILQNCLCPTVLDIYN